MRKHLTADDLAPLLAGPSLAVLATRRKDGSTLLSPVWHEWQDGGFSIVIGASDVKAQHLRRDPRATVVVAEHGVPYRSFELRGTATLSSPPDCLDTLRRIATRYLGEAGGKAYADSTQAHEIELVRLLPGTVRAWDYADDFA